MDSPKLEAILELVSGKGDSMRIRGTPPSARAYLIAQICEEESKSKTPTRPKVVLCPTDELASEFCSDLEAVSTSLSNRKIKAQVGSSPRTVPLLPRFEPAMLGSVSYPP